MSPWRRSRRRVPVAAPALTDLSTQHLGGTIFQIGFRNNGASLDLRLPSGHVVEFSWVYDYGQPNISSRLGSNCEPTDGVCRLNHRHVRVTYKIRTSEEGVNLVPIAIDPIE